MAALTSNLKKKISMGSVPLECMKHEIQAGYRAQQRHLCYENTALRPILGHLIPNTYKSTHENFNKIIPYGVGCGVKERIQNSLSFFLFKLKVNHF